MWNGQGRRVSNPTIEAKSALKMGEKSQFIPPKAKQCCFRVKKGFLKHIS